jgi:fibronectin type 3 domain-containing protein
LIQAKRHLFTFLLAFFILSSASPLLGSDALGAASPLPSQLPSAPRDLSASPGNGKATLTWAAPDFYNGSAITEYWIYRGLEPGNSTLWTTLGNVTAFTDIGLTNGRTYYYSVSAKNAWGEGPRSAETYATARTTPSAPLNVYGVPGNLFINLTWEAPAFDGGATVLGYRVYSGTLPGGQSYLGDAGNSTFYICSRLQIGRLYYFKVAAYNVVGEGPKSNEVSAASDVVPGAPVNLIAKEGVRSISLTWTAPEANGGSPILGYRVLRGTSPGEETLLANISSGTRYDDLGLGDNATYYYQVMAFNAVGDGAASNEIFATSWDVPAPQILSVLEGNKQLTIYWNTFDNGGTDVLRYWIYRGTSPGKEKLITTLDNVLSYTDTGLINGQAYYYMITAENAVGIGFSDEVTGTPRTVPEAPVGLMATAGERYITLNWTKPSSDGGSPVLGYKVYRGLSSGSETFLADAGEATSFISAGLTNGRTYYFKVLAYNEAGDGPLSGEVSEKSGLTPSAPQDLHARAGDQYVYLSWTASAEQGSGAITTYRVFRGTEADGEASQPIAEVYSTTYNNTGLTNRETYYYVVRAVNSIGESPSSNEVGATPSPPGSVPSAPQNLEASGGYKRITLTWDEPLSNGNSTITGYKVYRGLFSGMEIYLTTVGGTTYVNTGLENETTYYYKVAAVNEHGTGPMSNQASATTTATNGTQGTGTNGTQEQGFDLFGFLSNSVFIVIVVIIAAAVIFWYVREKRKTKVQARKSADRLKNSAKAAGRKKAPGVK